MGRLVVVALAAVTLLTGCGGDPSVPDVDPPPAAEAPRLDDGRLDASWLAEQAEVTQIPRRVLRGYAGASVRLTAENPGCGLAWNTLAAIGRVESVHGQIDGSSVGSDGRARPDIRGIPLDGDGVRAISDTDGGALDGDDTWDRAVGPMQFIPETWERWGADGDGDGVEDPQDIDDAALAAGRYLCSVADLQGNGWARAILEYNASAEYLRDVAAEARALAE